MKKVSVILPVYRVEKYVERAVRSVMEQSYKELEIILVDDGSDDKSGEICDRLAKEDNRISVIHKENGGLSDARNAGLDAATGDYIAFVDSDDHIAKDFVESLVREIEENDADVAMCSYNETSDEGRDESVFSAEGIPFDGGREIYDSRGLLRNLYDVNHRDATYFIVAWNKVYKADLWKDIRFPKGRIHEDEATTYLIYEKAKKGVYLRRPLYAYFKMDESITRGRFNLRRLNWFDALDDRVAHFEEAEDTEMTEYALRARADGAIHYYYPLDETFPGAVSEKKRLKDYVRILDSENYESEDSGNLMSAGHRLFLFSPALYRVITCIDRDRRERLYQACFVLLMMLIAFVGLYKLGVKYVDPWDESRHGVNALEMLRGSHLFESTFMEATDYYNLKPPLSMWSLMISFLIFGKNVFALRFPSVVYYLITAAAAACFARRKAGRSAALAVLILLAGNTTPFLAHMVRAGDADSLYVMLFSFAMICMMNIREDERNFKLCGLFFALAFLTKSFHSGIIAVIGIVYLLATGLIKKISKKEWLNFIYCTLIPLVVWAGARFTIDGPSFFKKMWETDVLGRSKTGFGSNEAGFSYYFSYYFGKMSGSLQIYTVALVLCILCLILIAIINRKKAKGVIAEIADGNYDIFIGFTLWICITLLAFSSVSTKLLWYIYPAVTGLLIATGYAVGKVFALSAQNENKAFGIAAYVLIAAAFLTGLIYSVRLIGVFHNHGINGNAVNDFQLVIKETGEKFPGASEAYVFLADGGEEPGFERTEWAQQDVFMAEAYGDSICRQGGVEAAIRDAKDTSYRKNTIIYMSNNCLDEVENRAASEGFSMNILVNGRDYSAISLSYDI